MTQQHYLILDGSQIDNIIKTIYQLEKSVSLDVLFINTRFTELQEVSPVLVNVAPDSPLWQKFETDWQEDAGIHITADKDIYTIGNHLRSALQAKINQQPVLFRFYDPRILQLWFETINQEERNQFMGPITNLYLPSVNGKPAIEYQNDHDLVWETPDTIWIELNDNQLAHLVQAKKYQIHKQIKADLKDCFPEKMQALNEAQQTQLISQSEQKARSFGSDTAKDIYYWSIIILHKGSDFPNNETDPIYQAILADQNYSPQDRLNNLLLELANQQQIA